MLFAAPGVNATALAASCANVTLPSAACPTVGAFVQSYFGYKPGFVYWTALILLAYVAFFRLLAAFALRFINYQKR